jgi:hypothetical protein
MEIRIRIGIKTYADSLAIIALKVLLCCGERSDIPESGEPDGPGCVRPAAGLPVPAHGCEFTSQSKELTRGPRELVQHFRLQGGVHIGARALHFLTLIWFG